MQARDGTTFLIALIAGVGVIVALIIAPFITPLILAAAFAVILSPLQSFLLRFIPSWRASSAGATVAIALCVFIMPLALIGTHVTRQAITLYQGLTDGDARDTLSELVRDVESRVIAYYPGAAGTSEKLTRNLSTYAQAGLQWVISHAGGAAASVAATFLAIFIFLIALFYFLYDGARIRTLLIEYSPLDDRYDDLIFERLGDAVHSVVRGNLTIALIQGALTTIGFSIFGVPNALLWGTAAAVGALIPGLGTGLVLVPAIAYLFFVGQTISAVLLIAWGILAVGLVDNVLGPRLIGAGIHLHPLAVLVAVLGGISLFGPVGVFLGPLAVSFCSALIAIYHEVRNS